MTDRAGGGMEQVYHQPGPQCNRPHKPVKPLDRPGAGRIPWDRHGSRREAEARVGTPYQCLEEVAACVAPIVPTGAWIVHVEVDFKEHPFAVTFAVAPYERSRPHDPSERAPLAMPPEPAGRVRKILGDYFDQVQAELRHRDQSLVFLRVSVTRDGSFVMAQSCRQGTGIQ